MLVVITGADSINKRLIARQINSKCNVYYAGAYKLNFAADPFLILDKNLKALNIQDFLLEDTENNVNIIKIANDKYDQFLDFEKKNYYSEQFLDIGYDLGVMESPEHKTRKKNFYSNEKRIVDILNKYKKSKLKYYVITGNFSKTALTELKEGVGSENILVLNFLRHPSVGYFLNKKNYDFFESNKRKNEKEDTQKYVSSLINSMLLKDVDWIKTIKFEEYIKNDFYINDINTGLYIDYNAKNSYLTTYEYDIKKDTIKMSEEELKEFNNIMSDFCIYDDIDEHEQQLIIKHDLENINIFERLGYEPITIKEMCTL